MLELQAATGYSALF